MAAQRIDYRTPACMERQKEYGRIRREATKMLMEIHKKELNELMELVKGWHGYTTD